MAKTHHYDLGDAILRIDENERDGYLSTLVQLDAPMGVVKLLEAQTHKLIDCLLEWSGQKAQAPVSGEADAIIANLREQLAQAQADNDLAQQEIARLTADKPKRGRPKKEADAPPAEWDSVPAEPVTDQGAQADHLPGFAVGDQVETVATGELGVVERLFADNPSKVQAAINGRPHVFDVSMLRLVAPLPSLPIPQGSDLAPQGSDLDVPELIAGLEAAGLTVLTEVPELPADEDGEPDPSAMRAAIYQDAKAFGFAADEMRDLIAEITGLRVTTKDLDGYQLRAVLRAMHAKSQTKLPF